MSGYLLDTNHLGQAVTPDSPVCVRLDQVRRAGVRVGTCLPVLCELEVGIAQVSKPAEYRQALDRLLRRIRIWPLDRQTAQIYAELYQEARRRGRVLSQVDLMLAALAQQMRLTVLTSDRDFEALPHVRIEDWTGPESAQTRP